MYRVSPIEPWRIVRTRLRVAGLAKGPIEGGGRSAGYFTGATGVTIYRGDSWPAEMKGLAFVGDVGGNLIHRKKLAQEGTNTSHRESTNAPNSLRHPIFGFAPLSLPMVPMVRFM